MYDLEKERNKVKTFGQILKELRDIHNVTGEELGKVLSVSRNAISNWENNRRTPDTNTIKALANYFNVTTDYLLGNNQETKRKVVKVPIFEEKQLSIPLNVVEEVLNYKNLTSELANTGTFFALKIQDKSMEPKLLEEDIVIIRQQNTVENGEIAVVLVNGKEATIKQIIKQDNGIILNGFNSSVYPPVFYTNQQIEELPITILGKVIESRREF